LRRPARVAAAATSTKPSPNSRNKISLRPRTPAAEVYLSVVLSAPSPRCYRAAESTRACGGLRASPLRLQAQKRTLRVRRCHLPSAVRALCMCTAACSTGAWRERAKSVDDPAPFRCPAQVAVACPPTNPPPISKNTPSLRANASVGCVQHPCTTVRRARNLGNKEHHESTS